MMGDRPTSLDASAYAFLANVLWVPLESPLKAHAQKCPQLEAYYHSSFIISVKLCPVARAAA